MSAEATVERLGLTRPRTAIPWFLSVLYGG